MSSISPPAPFNPDGENWELYMERFYMYMEANDLLSLSEQRKTALFLTHCGPAVFNMAKALAAPAELTAMTWTSLQGILKAHYAPQGLSLVRRHQFYRRDQKEGETISEFVASLREIASACDFVSLEEAMRDRLVLGVRDLTLQSRLLARPQITFKEALEEASVTEASQKSTAAMKKIKKGPQGKEESSVHYEEAEMESEEEKDEDKVHHLGPDLKGKPKKSVGCEGNHPRAEPSSPQKSRPFQASRKRQPFGRSRKSNDSGHQGTITDYFRSRSHISRCSNNVAESHKIRDEEHLENFTLDSESEESSSDGTVQQEVQDVEVDPLSDAQPELSGTTSGDDVSQIVADPDNEEAGVVLRQQPVQPALESDSKKAEEDVVSELISWKMLYNQYLEKVDHASLIVGVILQRYGLTKEHRQCMLGFIRCVATVRTCHCEVPTAALTCLQRHSLYPKAEVCIARRLPDLDGRKESLAYIRAVMAAIVLFAGGFCDIQELVDYLQSPSSSMSLTDTLEILYSTATLLYAMRENEVQISNRFHYSVSYCLHHLENSPGSTPSINDPELPSSGGGFRPVLQPTSEQQLILNHKLNPGDRVKIVGSAGTGKTSTLLQYARKWSEVKFLFIVFNKIKKQSLLFCPENVTCKTFHSLAYNEVGKNYRNKFIRDIQTDKIHRVLSNSRPCHKDHAKRVVQTLKAFFASADESITVEHTSFGEDLKERKKQIIVEEAKQIWTKMKALGPTKEKAYHMPFDGYLKLWQLQRPSLSKYDVIMVDEAQDCTHAMMSIVLLQKCPVILVGNPHQQIYTFRGADNTVLDVPNSRIFYLTQNFRFGYEIAYVGATLLDVSRKIRKTPVGNNQDCDVSVEGKVAWLSRTNRNVFDNAVKVIDEHPSAKIHFLGGIKAVGLDIIEDLWKVMHPERNLELTTDFIREYKDEGLRSINDYASIEDEQLSIKIRIVEDHDEHIPELVKRIRQCHVLDPESADYILGTAHKAKGMEFDTVKIDDEFMTHLNLESLCSNKIALPEDIPEDEWNLLYVAVTRAKKRLILPKFFAHILKFAKEYCVRFELSTTLRDTKPPVCVQCSLQVYIPAGPVLIPKRINHPYIADDTETPKGFLCPSCATCELGPIAELAGYSRMEQGAENIVVPFEARSYLEDI